MSTVSAVFVNWHASSLLAQAIASARAASSLPLEVIVVDNSCDADEAERVRALDAEHVVISSANEGYGGGANRGAALATGEWLILSNPDVVFQPGAIDELRRALEDGASLAGPRFVWDAEGRWLLPPADEVTLAGKLAEVLATRSAFLFTRRDRARARRRMEFWTQRRPVRRPALSGAVLALRRSLFTSLGGFDERFHLYFEETDLVRRVERKSGAAMHVPSAVVRHLYNQSAMRRNDRESVYLESERRFFRKWYGSDLLLRLGRPLNESIPAPPATRFSHPGALWIEASPEPHFLSAAGCPASEPLVISADVQQSLRGGALWLRAIDATGNELARWRLAPSASNSA